MWCAFGAHLDVGLAKRPTPCRFIELVTFPSFVSGKMAVFWKEGHLAPFGDGQSAISRILGGTPILRIRLRSGSFILVTWLNYAWHDSCEFLSHVPDASDKDESYHTHGWSYHTRGGVWRSHVAHTHSWKIVFHSHQLCKFFTTQSLLKREAQDYISNTPVPLAQPITNDSHFFLSFEDPNSNPPKEVTSQMLCHTVHIFNLFLVTLCVTRRLATISLYVQVFTDTHTGTFTQWDVVASDRAVEPRVRVRVGTGRKSQKSDSHQYYFIKSL